MPPPRPPKENNLNQIDRLPRTEPKSLRLVKNNIARWKPGNDLSPERRELEVVWEWMEAQAKEENKSLHDMPVQNAGVRLSLAYMRWVLDGRVDFTEKELRHEAMASLDEFLKWNISEMGAFTYRLETLTIKKRLRRRFALVEEKLMEGIKQGKTVDMQTWLKATGNYMEEGAEKDGFRVISVLEIPEDEKEKSNEPVVTPPE